MIEPRPVQKFLGPTILPVGPLMPALCGGRSAVFLLTTLVNIVQSGVSRSRITAFSAPATGNTP